TGPKKIQELIDETKIPQTSIYRIVGKLVSEGSVERMMGRVTLTTNGRMRYTGQLEN
ncbi:unnamed protein product, partial [marine sediment metagenome]